MHAETCSIQYEINRKNEFRSKGLVININIYVYIFLTRDWELRIGTGGWRL